MHSRDDAGDADREPMPRSEEVELVRERDVGDVGSGRGCARDQADAVGGDAHGVQEEVELDAEDRSREPCDAQWSLQRLRVAEAGEDRDQGATIVLGRGVVEGQNGARSWCRGRERPEGEEREINVCMHDARKPRTRRPIR